MQQEKNNGMATNASTWFYREPEHDAYLLEERVNHTFWANRIYALYLDCTNAEPPFRMEGVWHDLPVTVEWVPNQYFTLTTQPGELADMLIVGVKEVLGFKPAISYVDPSGQLTVEWLVGDAAERVQEIQGNPNYSQIRRYK